ncbi:MAG: bstEII [Verrucomicrobia bacterium]|nr:MAG: bstEII [Verrucomicrobiota bacterium]
MLSVVKPRKVKRSKTFADYKADARNWITLATGEYYPDILKDACELYKPVLVLFGQLLKGSESSIGLFMQIVEQSDGWMRVQLARVFRKYISPETPVEMLKQKSKAKTICDQFGKGFRPIHKAQAAFTSRPIPDEALCAVLWEYKDRGKKGYDLTERFFSVFRSNFPEFPIKGPERAGKDVLLGEVFENYPKPDRPVDFVVYDSTKMEILAIGLARYDSDRGGAQEDDRTGGYLNCADEILTYAKKHRLRTKVIFVNDGPGLLLGSMWDDYAYLERSRPGKIMVATLRMIPERITRDWLFS